jgi:superkiller protein 3
MSLIKVKNVATWTNLGLLYFHHGDLELSNEAFHRAQSLDPDYTLTWVGLAIIAAFRGQNQEAKTFFEHAVGLPTGVVRTSHFPHVKYLSIFLTGRSRARIRFICVFWP